MENFEKRTNLLVGEHEYDLTPRNLELLRKLADQAMESGLILVRDDAASDYIDSLLPA